VHSYEQPTIYCAQDLKSFQRLVGWGGERAWGGMLGGASKASGLKAEADM
jgi:hypothetical protein